MTVSRRQWLGGVASAAVVGSVPVSVWAASDPWAKARAIVAAISAPVIPDYRVDITDFGAVGDGVTKNTDAIARAIAACVAAGGGQVRVPEGRFLTGAIHLSARIDLHLEEGATLLFSTDTADYPPVFTRWEGVELINYSPLIYAKGVSHVSVTGKGVLDGQGANERWWSWSSGKRFGWKEGMATQHPARNRLFQMAEDGVPPQQRVFGDGDYLRPCFIQFYGCDTVRVEGVTLKDAPFWNIHPVLSRNVIVSGVTVTGHGPNNDGCNPESVDHMLIENCLFDTGDDCIAIKSGRNADGRRINVPSQNIVIRNCEMKDGHGGVVIGSEISGGVHHVFAENCRMDSPELWYAFRFKTNARRGGVLEHFHFRDITIGEVERSVLICDFNYEEGAKGEFTPVVRDITIERVTARKAVRVIDIQGLPHAPVRNVTLRDCRFDGVTEADIVKHASGIRLTNVYVNGKKRKSAA